MKLQKKGLATLGLIFITFLSAIQYGFLKNCPDTIPEFALLSVTNVIGLAILGIARFKKLVTLRKKTLVKGIVMAAELIGFNFFLLLGSRGMENVIISSVVSLYFVFVTPILLLLRKRVNFFSGIATVIAIIALLLMFGADTDALFSSVNVVYLILADIFFAAYVITVSILGEGEDSTQLTLAQMTFSALLAFIGWLIQCSFRGVSLALPTDTSFWISAVYLGVFIRAIYGLVQISCQKYVSALKASLIFSAEIIITLLTAPFLSEWLGMEYTPATFFQIVGAFLLIIATLMVDETIMSRLGYADMQDQTYVNDSGETVYRSSVSRKMIMSTLTFALVTLVLSAITFLSAIHYIRTNAVQNSQALGKTASTVSSDAMMEKLEESIQNMATDKALLAEQKLSAYSDSILYAASYADSLYKNADQYPEKEVDRPLWANKGIWAMQRTLANEGISYDDLRAECRLLGNMEDVFRPIIENNENIATIYMGTENGLLISYDTSSDSGNEVGESYYEYRYSGWYQKAKTTNGCFFTEPYQDGYGRGLTISCVAPFHGADGQYAGCVAMDILMADLNASMVNDGIQDPSVATLIDHEGNYIAGRDVDPVSENMGSIFDESKHDILKNKGKEILEKKNGFVIEGEGDQAKYIAYATIDSTDWTLCIMTPVSTVIKPAIKIRESIDENTKSVIRTVTSVILNVIQTCLLLSALILLFVTLFTGRVSKKISDPLKRLEADVHKISEGNLDNRTTVNTDDEIGSLAHSFNHMTDSLQKYIADLKDVTAKEERIAGELSAATTIQNSMLPRNFDEFNEHSAFDLYATMDPAKEVGGDFYDFFLVDDDHIALVMADVSGKGVPAALFMAISRTLIKNRAQLGESPAEILAHVNEQLCENNEAELFVTVWLAIIELSTGKGIAANAGHEHPVIRRGNGLYELVQYRHSPAVAVMNETRFREHTFEINPGDNLFVYTDGVPEATNLDNELFGTGRMLDALNRDPGASPRELLRTVKQEMDEFVGDAPQFDDITMLSFRYTGSEGTANA